MSNSPKELWIIKGYPGPWRSKPIQDMNIYDARNPSPYYSDANIGWFEPHWFGGWFGPTEDNV